MRKFGITKTTVVGFLTMLAGVAEFLSNDAFILSHPELVKYILMFNGFLMIALRFVTYTPIFGEQKK